MFTIKYKIEPVESNRHLAQIYVRCRKTNRKVKVGILPYGPVLSSFEHTAMMHQIDDTTLGAKARAKILRDIMTAVIMFHAAAFGAEVK